MPARPSSILYERPYLYPKQLAAIFAPERIAYVEASTKCGKTVGCLVWIFEQAASPANGTGRNYWWVAPILAQAKIAFRRMKSSLPKGVFKANESELTITLLNGAVLWFKSGDNPDSLYGEDVFAAVIDEHSRVKPEAWYAVRTTLTATQGPIRLIGNVKGRANWAYKLGVQARDGAPGMAYAKLTAYDAVEAGVLAAEEVESAKATLPEAVFRELYLAEPSDDEGNPFDMRAIRDCTVSGLSGGAATAWGVDLAKSVDWTVVLGLDPEGNTVSFDRWQHVPWQESMDRIRGDIGQGHALVDSTGVGDPVLEALQRGGSGHFEGFKFTSASKQQLMEGLAVGIQHRQLRFPAGPIVTELEAFEYTYTRTGVRYSAPEGVHDDCVMALGLAWHALSQYSEPVEEDIERESPYEGRARASIFGRRSL